MNDICARWMIYLIENHLSKNLIFPKRIPKDILRISSDKYNQYFIIYSLKTTGKFKRNSRERILMNLKST